MKTLHSHIFSLICQRRVHRLLCCSQVTEKHLIHIWEVKPMEHSHKSYKWTAVELLHSDGNFIYIHLHEERASFTELNKLKLCTLFHQLTCFLSLSRLLTTVAQSCYCSQKHAFQTPVSFPLHLFSVPRRLWLSADLAPSPSSQFSSASAIWMLHLESAERCIDRWPVCFCDL